MSSPCPTPSLEAASAYVAGMMKCHAADYPLCVVHYATPSVDNSGAVDVFIEYALNGSGGNTNQGKWTVWYERDAHANLRLYGEW